MKKIPTSLRITNSEKSIMDTIGIGAKRVFEVGLHALQMTLHGSPHTTCTYITITRGKPAPPAPQGGGLAEGARAESCCCSCCPIRLAFQRTKKIDCAVPTGPHG